MTEAAELEWSEIVNAWHSDRSAAPTISISHLRRRVRRRTALLWATAAGEIIVIAYFVRLTRTVLAEQPTPFGIAWAAVLWILTGAVTLFAIHNRRGLWTPAARSSADYVALAIRHSLARVRSARAVRRIASLEMFLVMPILIAIRAAGNDSGMVWPDIIEAAVATALLCVALVRWSWTYQRRATAELDELRRLDESLRAEPLA